MEIEFASLDDSLARFTLSGASTAFANAFRRAMIGEVPTLAIEDVRIYDNTSALFDEMLAHRVGLIPLKTDLSSYSTQENCSCGGAGCPGCTSTYTLSVEGPRTVMSSDLIPQDPKAAPVYRQHPHRQTHERAETRHRGPGQSSIPGGHMPSGSRHSSAGTRTIRLYPSAMPAMPAASALTNAPAGSLQ